MATFTPCQGKNACRDNGMLCLTCGRKLSEVAKLRELMQELTALAIDHDYENVDEYAQYIARKVVKMIDYQRQELTN
ncbi:MAG: hypothetical protein B6D77_08560 [gamma proteobacterium symbiont of Ctena orbiculata]|uniref:hypothetical protein n=1 Tax=Candidatus Thiodiazotropha sp. CDECU1 TaxID=3065865 RepID=UPI000D5786A1|nr:hypothetical protein [Candidatus Thiodiazotropha sp. CDECU1]PVV10201.1 MAG: hypothetical protein B6D77_08560 [gamma proteobacterium symbiont of Ctena orbiculata]PVV17531.1 MAG: hypothetical protein B6D79_16755 [gamma proteobacterium symbiont of Ctena orbiculata]PVV18442.1 MAG: hypothetical protein B6D78_16250 [gamma proteobacterium symbiont of Ctena orbiculata]